MKKEIGKAEKKVEDIKNAKFSELVNMFRNAMEDYQAAEAEIQKALLYLIDKDTEGKASEKEQEQIKSLTTRYLNAVERHHRTMEKLEQKYNG